MARRYYGTGTMTERSPGVWRLRAYLGRDPVSGSPRQVSKTVHGGKREARAALNELIREIEEGKKVGTNAPLSRLLADWLRQAERLGRSPGTIETYRRWINTRINPALGEVNLSQLTTHRIDAFLADLAASGLATSTVKTIRNILKAALEQGVRWQWLATNPAKATRVAEPGEVDRMALTEVDVSAIIQSAEADDPDLAALIATAAWIGARRGELCALRWSDIDWIGEVLVIERAWVPGVGGQQLRTTKTGKARSIPIPQAIEIFRFQQQRKVEMFGALPVDGYIFGSDDGTTPPRAKSVTEFFSKHAKRAGVAARFHDLRHFAVSRAIANGWDVTTAGNYFGHTPQVMLSIYSHGTIEDARAAAKALPPIANRGTQ